ncbi:MAG: recombinase family protein [Fuerstiella sp.]
MKEAELVTNATGYLRVSTATQVDEGISLESQRAKIEGWCEVNDVELKGIYEDAGLSGKRADNRPALQEALDTVIRNKGVLVVYSLSRLARSTKDTLQIAERIDRAGADLVSLSEKIDTTSAAGKMVFRLLAVLNEFERDLISERTTAAMAHLRMQNRYLGQVPYGFRLSGDMRTLEADETETETVNQIKKLRANGLSLRAIARRLDIEGVQAKSGKKWCHTSVASVLRRLK